MKKKGLLTAIIGIALVLVLALALPLGACAPAPPVEKVYKVCITQIATHPSLDACRQGFFDQMAEEGFIEGEDIVYIIRSAEGDMTVAASTADYFVSIKPDLIVPITTPSAQTVVAAAEGTDIPIVFSLVTDPVAAGLVPSWEEAAPYVTGVSDWVDIPTQVAFILEIVPAVKNLGLIYNAGEVNSVVQAEMLNDIAPDYGLTIVEATAASTADVYAAAMSLVGRVDAVLMPTDNTIFSAIDSVIKVAEENDMPFFASSIQPVNSGAIAAVGIDPYLIGKQSAEMAAKILRGEATPADITPEKSAYLVMAVNPAAAERMGITIPQAAIDKADIVVEG